MDGSWGLLRGNVSIVPTTVVSRFFQAYRTALKIYALIALLSQSRPQCRGIGALRARGRTSFFDVRTR
jgi:hypothetical protein